ncbi:MAG: hypothetical protein QME92_03800 [Bacillota bacterium]|nr:hypothetical protein [Bacillota bacterium]
MLASCEVVPRAGPGFKTRHLFTVAVSVRVHEYARVDPAVVYGILKRGWVDFVTFIDAVNGRPRGNTNGMGRHADLRR